jgi:hypothetical protein
MAACSTHMFHCKQAIMLSIPMITCSAVPALCKGSLVPGVGKRPNLQMAAAAVLVSISCRFVAAEPTEPIDLFNKTTKARQSRTLAAYKGTGSFWLYLWSPSSLRLYESAAPSSVLSIAATVHTQRPNRSPRAHALFLFVCCLSRAIVHLGCSTANKFGSICCFSEVGHQRRHVIWTHVPRHPKMC